MGVVWVVNYPVPEGKTGQQMVDVLHKRVEQLGATKTGNFSVDCEMYQGKHTQPPRVVHILHNSEQPATCFAILDTNTCLVSDTQFNLLMVKLKDYYMLKKMSKVETKGVRFELGDFVIKIGSVIMGGSIFKGILVEVEYLPCVVAIECEKLMQEFLQGFMGETLESTNHLKHRENDLYEPADTMKQYLEHYNNIRRASSMQSQAAAAAQMGQQQQQQQMQLNQQHQQQMQMNQMQPQPQQQQHMMGQPQMGHHPQMSQQQQQIPIPVGINQMGMGHR